MPDMYQTYKQEIVGKMIEKRGYGNHMQVPRLKKIVVSTGIGTAKDRDAFNEAKKTLTMITGQMAVVTNAKKSVSNFKLRKGMPVGVMVTLRRGRMYDFHDRLVHNALPRVRDFRGLSPKGFDHKGNYNMGVQDVSVFTEIDLDKLKHPMGLNITFVTDAKTDEEAYDLLKLMEMPFA